MKKNNIMRAVAWSLASVVLGGALVYYNFIYQPPTTPFAIGEECPDFTAKQVAYNGTKWEDTGETFSLSDYKGKVVIVNFWATWCADCVKELPDFDRVYKEYSDEVELLAVADKSDSMSYMVRWLNGEGWKSHSPNSDWKPFTFTIGQNDQEDLFSRLGGSGAIPRTVIVDKNGVAVAEANKLNYEELKALIEPYLSAEE